MSDETDSLSDQGVDQEVDDLYREEKITDMERQYAFNKSAKVGVKVHCPTCGTGFKKKTSGHTFCTNQRKVRGRSSCKDTYWNMTDERKRAYVNEK